MIKKYLFINLILILGIPQLKAQVFHGVPFIQTFGSNEYEAGIQNWDIGQDARGFLYFANNFGLLEYDGSHWKTYPVKTGSKVRCLSIAPDGRIYVGVQGDFGFFAPSAKGEWIYTSIAMQLPVNERDFDETWRIYQYQGKVYFFTFQNIYVYDGKSIETIYPEHPIEFSFLVDNKIYVLDWEVGLTTLEGSQLIPVNNGDFFMHKRIVAILPYNLQKILIVTQKDGLFLYDGQQMEALPSPFSNYTSAFVDCAIRLQNGFYAFGSQSSGIFLLNQHLELIHQIDKGHGLNDHTVTSLFEDRHQNVWVGHNHGISYVELSSPFTLLDEKLNIPGSGYAAEIHNDTLYLGTNNGLFAGAVQDWNGMQFQKVQNSQGQVYHLSTHDNKLLMGHHEGGFEIRNLKAYPISKKNGSWKFLQLQNNPQMMMEGNYYGFSLYQQMDTQWKWVQDFSDFTESSRIFEEDREGNIWMAHGYKGIYKLRFNLLNGNIEQQRFYGQEDGLPSNVLNNLYEINKELIFTGETGVFRYDKVKDRFYEDTILTNILGKTEHIQKLSQAEDGKIYFLGNQKIGSIRLTSSGKWETDISRFNKVHKLLNDDLNFLAVLNEENILFGAKEGFIHFNPNLPDLPQAPFSVYIRSVHVSTPQDSLLFAGNYWNNQQLAVHQPEFYINQLPYESNSIRFRFSSPFFDGPEHIHYQYMLEGFDTDWSHWNGQEYKEYTNLPEGEFTFRVRSRNIYGDISPEDIYQFVVLPPWYRASWAYFFYSLLAISTFLGGLFIIDRKHRKEKDLMKVKQLKALQQKKIELNNLSKRSEEEINRLNNEKLESEILHKNKELATSTMHIVSKNEFIGEIKHHLNLIIKENATKAINKDLNKIIKEIDQNIATDKDWEQFQFHFDQVHGDFSKRLKADFPNLTPQEMKLCAYLRLNLSTKEIAQLMHISVRGVEISRYRLRKKLELDRQENLLDYILNF